MSQGESTIRPMMAFFKLGAYCDRVSMTASPKASRFCSQVPSLSLYGAYWTKMDITCFPGGASEGSINVGIMTSMYGLLEKSPYFASS